MFEDVTLSWAGVDYTVDANAVMPLIAKVEAALTKERDGESAFQVIYRDGGPPLSYLAMAYGTALRAAGAVVRDEQVYAQMFSEKKKIGDKAMAQAVAGIIALLIPPAHFNPSSDKQPGKPAAS